MAGIRDFRCSSSGIVPAMLLGLGVSFGAAAAGWPEYGGDAGGRRYSMASQVTPASVRSLEQVWTFRTGELGENLARRDKLTVEATPILVGRTLYFSTATAIVHAIDAVTGRPLWRHDAALDRRLRYSEVASRGVRLRSRPEYGVTSPPVVIGGLVVVGSAIGDNRATNLELGVVRAYDALAGALAGALRWHWDPIPRDAIVPRDAANPLFTEVDEQAAQWTGAANAWAPLSVARERGLVFVGAATDDDLRAFDVRTGEELWQGRLPGGGQATPMTYEIDGRQFVVIAAGGHAGAGTTLGDTLVAFSLPPR